jgi:hypothetical protein
MLFAGMAAFPVTGPTGNTTGIIKAKKGDTLHFSFSYTRRIHQLQLNSNIERSPTPWYYTEGRRNRRLIVDTLLMKRQVYIPFKKEGDRYEFTYIVPSNDLYYIDILIDFRRALKFNVQTGS